MKITLLGTADSALVPVYNCDCIACVRARNDRQWRRRPASALLEVGGRAWLIDSGLTDLRERFAPGQLQGIFQTHYHADHAQGLLTLRWGVNMSMPVYGPEDDRRFADLTKHSGILDFSPVMQPFQQRDFEGFTVCALPLIHSRPTLGYEFVSSAGRRIAYLTDTVGLPPEVITYLKGGVAGDSLPTSSDTGGAVKQKSIATRPLDVMIIDCSFEPMTEPHRNHNDLSIVRKLQHEIQAKHVVLTHIGHRFDRWLMTNPGQLPADIVLGQDGMVFEVG